MRKKIGDTSQGTGHAHVRAAIDSIAIEMTFQNLSFFRTRLVWNSAEFINWYRKVAWYGTFDTCFRENEGCRRRRRR